MSATCTYNGISFNSLYHSHVSSRPVMDEAQRTTIYVEHTLEVEGYVTPNVVTGTTDADMSSARKALTAQGGALNYSSKGFGDLMVNVTAGGVRDAAWGPRPEILEWIPLGGDGAGTCKVVWRVTTRIPECTGAVYLGAPLAINYEQDFSIDQAGYTTVTTSGYLEIPMTRRTQSDRSLPDSADLYRERLQSAVIFGYQRVSQDYKLSKDKRRLDFSWTDEEIPTALPERVAHIEARQTIYPSKYVAGIHYTVTLEATIIMAQGVPKSEALRVFLLLVSARIGALRRVGDGTLLAIPTQLRVEEDIFGRSSSFTIGVVFVAAKPDIPHFLANQSQLWKPVPTDHSLWQTSLQAFGTQSVRGYNKAFASPNSDGIVDLCIRREGAPGVNGNAPNRPQNSDLERETRDVLGVLLKNLTPFNSWMAYRVWLIYHERSGAIRHKLLLSNDDSAARNPTAAEGLGGGVTRDPTGSDDELRGFTGAGIEPAERRGVRPPDPIQRPTTPSRRIWLYGWGRRLGYRVPVPRLVSVGGVTPIEVDRIIHEEPDGGINGIPVYYTGWRIEYLLPSAPDGVVELPADIALGIDGTKGPAGKLTP